MGDNNLPVEVNGLSVKENGDAPEENGDIVTPWDVSSGSATGVDYDKLIGEKGEREKTANE